MIEKSLAIAYVESKGWTYTESSDQLVLDCPICGKAGKFYMNVNNGMWDCKVCGRTGNLKTLRKELGDPIDGVQSMQDGVDAAKPIKPLPDLFKHHKQLIDDAEAMD